MWLSGSLLWSERLRFQQRFLGTQLTLPEDDSPQQVPHGFCPAVQAKDFITPSIGFAHKIQVALVV